MHLNIKPIHLFCLLFFLVHIPLLLQDVSHTQKWRQADTAAVAKNFRTESANVLYPRIDMRGNKTGITGMEFPLYQYLAGLLYYLFDVNTDLPGKLISLISVFILLFFLIKLANLCHLNLSSESIAIVLFSFPFVFFYATAFMPELFALTLCVIGLYFFYQYRLSYSNYTLIIATLFLCSSSLTRPFIIFLCFPLLSQFFSELRKKQLAYPVLLSGAVILTLFSVWYFYWSPFLVKHYGINYFYAGSPLSENLSEMFSLEFLQKLLKEIFQVYLGWIWVPFFLYGIYYLNLQKNTLIFSLTMVSLIGIICLGLFSGWHFTPHNYYLIFCLPILIYSTAFSLDKLLKKYHIKALTTGVLIIIFTALSQIHIYREDKSFKTIKPQLESIQAHIPESDLVIVEDIGGNPYSLHHLRRKGWVRKKSMIYQYNHIEKLKEQGAKWVIPIEFNQSTFYSIHQWLEKLSIINKS